MPLYVYECKGCGFTKEEIHTVADMENSGLCECGSEFFIVIQPVRAVGEIFGFNAHYDYQLGRHFESAAEKKDFLDKKGFIQEGGDNSPRKNEGMRVNCTKDEAKRMHAGEINPFKDKKKIQVGG